MSRTYIIAEIANAHGHSLNLCKELLNSAKDAGADAFKVATYTAEDITIDCNRKEFQLSHKIWSQYGNLWDLYKNIHMPWDFHLPLFELGSNLQIDVFSSPFSTKGVDYLETNFNPPVYKIASMESVHYPLIEHIAKINKPIIISFGRSRSMDEMKYSIELIRRYNDNDVTVLHCISEYPTPINKANLSSICYFKKEFEEYKIKVGISDHSEGILIPMLAVALGAEVVEKHITKTKNPLFENGLPNPDVDFSMTPDFFKAMCFGIRQVEQVKKELELEPIEIINYVFESNSSLKNFINKSDLSMLDLSLGRFEEINPTNITSGGMRRSLIYTRDVMPGETLVLGQNFSILRPGHGLNPVYLNKVSGSILLNNVSKGEGVKFEDFT